MAYASQSGRARTSAKDPQAFAVCMRCGFWYNRVELAFQWEWSGAQLRNTYLLVCKPCTDTPQEQLRAIVLPADPVPIYYPSVENFTQAETDYHAVSAAPVTDPGTGIPIPPSTLLVTEDDQNMTQQPMGRQQLAQAAIMPWNGSAQYGVALPVYAINSAGTTVITVICSAVHNLQTNAQVAVEGVTSRAASGFFSVTVTTANTFTYETATVVPAGSLLTATTLIWTAQVGLPYGYEQIPSVA